MQVQGACHNTAALLHALQGQQQQQQQFRGCKQKVQFQSHPQTVWLSVLAAHDDAQGVLSEVWPIRS